MGLAGILQPPFFDRSFPKASNRSDRNVSNVSESLGCFVLFQSYNFGSIGVIMGHELSHGFDDQGAQYTADGNLQPWWKDADQTNFRARTRCIAQQ